MTSYEERLPLIDKAIDYYKGKLPRKNNPNSSIVVHAFGRYYFISEEYFNTCGIESEFVCYEEEFEKRAKELGWINGYKFGVEYETNGKKPDLPDDTLVEFKSALTGEWESYDEEYGEGYDAVENWVWEFSSGFKIYDKRYAPTDVPVVRENTVCNSERDFLVMQARTLVYPMDVFHEPTARVMIEVGWRPTKEEK